MSTHPKEPNGGPAFPYNYSRQAYGSNIRELIVSEGMTLRDAFALAALPAIVQIYSAFILKAAETSGKNCAEILEDNKVADAAYMMADAMLERRLK